MHFEGLRVLSTESTPAAEIETLICARGDAPFVQEFPSPNAFSLAISFVASGRALTMQILTLVRDVGNVSERCVAVKLMKHEENRPSKTGIGRACVLWVRVLWVFAWDHIVRRNDQPGSNFDRGIPAGPYVLTGLGLILIAVALAFGITKYVRARKRRRLG